MSRQQKRKVSTGTGSVKNSALPIANRGNVSAEFNPDYTYVIQDLKKIGTLAVIFIAALVILSFII